MLVRNLISVIMNQMWILPPRVTEAAERSGRDSMDTDYMDCMSSQTSYLTAL